MAQDDEQLREKARLLLQRERELFELRLKHEQVGMWLNVGQALPQLFLIRSASLAEVCQGIRTTIVRKLRLQRVVLLEISAEALLPLAPAGDPRLITAQASALLGGQASGFCNDPETEPAPGTSALANALGLHRFMWSLIGRSGRPPILMAAGFDASKAAFQSPFSTSDAAHFDNAARQVESLLGNAQLIAELEQERNQLREANLTLETRDQALRQAAEQLRAANEGLEQRVQERTLELAGKNRDLRLVLDTVDQALLMTDMEGRLAPECSSTAEHWFGRHGEGADFVTHVNADERFSAFFRLGLDALREDILPREVGLDQLPTQFERASRQFECRSLPIETEGLLVGLLLVINDVTEKRARAREDAEQRELLAAFKAMMRDRIGFSTFFQEAERGLDSLSQAGLDDATRGLVLHTLKGNAGMFGLHRVAELCHRAESDLAEGDSTVETMQQLRERWTVITQTLQAVSPTQNATEISERDLLELTRQAQGGASAAEIVASVKRLRWEPSERVLGRLAEHAREIAVKLGKGPLQVEIDADAMRFDSEHWAPLWASLVHVVRNAIDHGVELPDDRRAAGKSSSARLTLRARRTEPGYRLEIADDGRGIDWETIQRACERSSRPCATRSELLQALLTPGFSTRADVTQLSGRGYGMAAVAGVVRTLSGQLTVASEPGTGTRWVFEFPEL